MKYKQMKQKIRNKLMKKEIIIKLINLMNKMKYKLKKLKIINK